VLMLLDELPGLKAQGSLTSGKREGETDLLLATQGDRLLSGEVRVDNTGSRSTGRERLLANLSLDSPLGGADTWATQLLHTEGVDYGRLAYARMIGNNGWIGGISASALHYQLVGEDFAALRSNGRSSSFGGELSIPLLRARDASANAQFSADLRRFSNLSNSVVTTDYAIRAASAGLSGQRSDEWLGGGALAASLTLVAGALDLDGSPNRSADAATIRADGQFFKLRYQLSRRQALAPDTSLNINWSGQRADKNLDSAERFYLGGIGGVRAYPASEIGGAEGDLLGIELSRRLQEGLTLSGLFDWGRVRVNVNNDFPGAPEKNHLSLRGAGLALNWVHGSGFSARLTWARRLGNNPNPTADGNDQDGTLIRDRFWLTAAWVF